MSYFVHGVTLASAWFLAVNVVLTLAVAAVARLSARSASTCFILRLLPAAASIAFVGAVFAPSYWRFEPRDFAEGVDLTITLAAAAAVAIVAVALARGAAAWWTAARRTRAWTQSAERLAVHGVTIPTFRIDAPQPLLALAGVLRPRLFVTRGLIDALTPEELTAGVAHEIGHHRAWDNLKRLAMRGAPDLLGGTAAARRLESGWAAAAEHDADRSASSSRAGRLALASALVKVARLMPAPARLVQPITEPISTLVGGGAIASRVEQLIADAPASTRNRRGVAGWLAAATAAAALLGVGYVPLLEAIHSITELAVHHLP